jgi:hypothetical protein
MMGETEACSYAAESDLLETEIDSVYEKEINSRLESP